MFDFAFSVSGECQPCSPGRFQEILRLKKVADICADIRDAREKKLRGEMSREDFDTYKQERKRHLPVFMFQAHYPKGRRRNADALPSGLAMFDIDHINQTNLGKEQGKEGTDKAPSGNEQGKLYETLIDHTLTFTPITDEPTLKALKALGIVLAHVTPSAEGLRLVFRIPDSILTGQAGSPTTGTHSPEKAVTDPHGSARPGTSTATLRPARPAIGNILQQSQRWLARQLGIAQYDEACRDLARCSFAVPEDYVLYVDGAALFEDRQLPPIKTMAPAQPIKSINSTAPLAQAPAVNCAAAPVAASSAAIPAKSLYVFDLCREQAGLKDVDINTPGSRHTSLLAILSVGAARLLSEQQAMSVVQHRMPDFYAESDCRQLIHDFYAKYHDDSKIMSSTVQRVNARAEQLARNLKERKGNADNTPADDNAAPLSPDELLDRKVATGAIDIPPIPAIKQSLIGVPKAMRMPVVCALMPLIATYADGITYRYCDGREQHLGLMSIIVGEQASGKSVCKDVLDIWRRPMEDADRELRRKEEEWKLKKKNRRANERLDPEPMLPIRFSPITISNSTLLKRLKCLAGHTLYSECSEIDTLTKTNNAGSWSSKKDCYRLGFDYDIWGQDYNSDQAESGMVHVAYNWTILGTYGGMRRFFKGDNVENGLSSRIIFAEMPDTAFAPLPTYKQRSDREVSDILNAVEMLKAKKGLVDTPRLRRAIAAWLEEKRQVAMQSIDRVMDTYRRRAAVIGMRCGIVAYLLSGEKETKHVIDFALLMANYVLHEQCKLFGDMLRRQFAEDAHGVPVANNRSTFDRLPKQFVSRDIIALKPDLTPSSARVIILRWKDAGWIKAMDHVKGQKFKKWTKIK